MRFVAAAISLALALVPGQLALASCIQQTVPEQADRAEVIVYGRVNMLEGPPSVPSRFAIFDVQRVLKGSAKSRIGVALGPEVGPRQGGAGVAVATSVDYNVKPGEEHTLYLKQNAPGGFSTDACAGSHAGPPTAEETALLGAGKDPDPAPMGIGGATASDRVAAGIATVVALAAGVAAIWYARLSARPEAAA